MSSSASASSPPSSSSERRDAHEEFRLWKKNVPFLYDLCMVHALEWPSLTLQWLPDNDLSTFPSTSTSTSASSSFNDGTRRLLLGTQTADGENNALLVAEVKLPVDELIESEENSQQAYSQLYGRMDIVQAINHPGDVLRARYMPQRSSVIASRGPAAEVYVFDRTQHVAKAARNAPSRPELRLNGHSKEGNGLSWSHMNAGHLLSAGEDCTICHWDVNASLQQDANHNSLIPSLQPLDVYRAHEKEVEEVSWHSNQGHVFASCGDDGRVIVWDTRGKSTHSEATCMHNNNSTKQAVLCIAFNPHNNFSLLAGSEDHTLSLLDLRNLGKKLHSFEQHTDEVHACVWSAFEPAIFASASADRRVAVWDVSKIGVEQSAEDAEDGPPELLFLHAGHTDRVIDLDWMDSTTDPSTKDVMNQWTIASVAEDNIVEIWSMSETIFREDEE